jgi:RNA polymerase sigma-70 factor (ECF subfamily)
VLSRTAEASPTGDAPHGARLSPFEQAAAAHFQFIWRCLRRFGVGPDHAVDDAAQRVFEIAAQKRHRIVPGSERAFLFKTALLVAVEESRARRRAAREQPDEVALGRARSETPRPDEALEAREWRARLDQVLAALPLELRTVFVLFECEELSLREIAELVELPVGTVASRLRRAREEFHQAARRLKAKLDFEGACA